MTGCPPCACLLAATESVQHRITSGLLDGFSQWWQLPGLTLAVAAIAAFVVWTYRRDAAELPRGLGMLLAALRIGAFAALIAAYLDLERTNEHEIVFPSRVAVLVDSSASMTLEDEPAGDAAPADAGTDGPRNRGSRTRSQRALDVLDRGGLLAALAPRHEVSVWRFDADAEPLTVLPRLAEPADADGIASRAPVAGVPGADADGGGANDASEPEGTEHWRSRLVPRGFETRIGESLSRVVDQEPTGVLAGVILLTDGANNAGVDPATAVSGLVKAGVPVHPLGIGSDRLPTNARVADLLVPSRVFPGDRFSVTGYVQSQGLAGQTVRVELSEASADDADGGSGPVTGRTPEPARRPGRLIDAREIVLAANGELSAVRFDVPGLESPGRRNLVLRIVPPAADRTPADDRQAAEIEVVDRVTQVLLMAGGPSREYQFMRNVLERDKSFAVDVLLGTAGPGVSQDARRILEAFPATAAELSEYDVVVAFDYDWRRLDQPAQARLERWVSRESGGLMLVAGNVFMDSWLADSQTGTVRNLHPVELRRPGQLVVDEPAGFTDPMPLSFTRDGQEAEFLWLGSSRIASQTVWSEFKGVFSCFDAAVAKPGATVYTRAGRADSKAKPGTEPIFMAGQFFGSGNVFFVGSGETWRLRAIDDSLFERLTTQLVRHVSQGRLLRGSRRARVLVDRDRFAVGSTVVVRVVSGEETNGVGAIGCTAVGPDGIPVGVPLAAEPGRPGVVQGAFVASREGAWRIDVELDGAAGEKLSRRIQARLPDRELARPRLDRGLIEQLASLSGGVVRVLEERPWTDADSRELAATIPDRSRREYETGAPDADFKRRLNAILLGAGTALLCLEWIVRRLLKLA